MCNTLPDHTCGEIEHCADALHRAGQNQDDDSASGDTDLGGEIAPQRVMSDAFLGGNWFQIRAVIFGEPGHLDAALRGVSKGNWGRSVRDEQIGNLEFLSRLGVSEAEFYFDAPGADARRDDWMWNMQWRARMRRFSLGDTALLTDGCSAAGGGAICDSMMAVSGALTNALAH